MYKDAPYRVAVYHFFHHVFHLSLSSNCCVSTWQQLASILSSRGRKASCNTHRLLFMSTPTLPRLVAIFPAKPNWTPGTKVLHNHQRILHLFVLWSDLQHLLPSLPFYLHWRDWAHPKGTFWWNLPSITKSAPGFPVAEHFSTNGHTAADALFRAIKLCDGNKQRKRQEIRLILGHAGHVASMLIFMSFEAPVRAESTWYRGATRNSQQIKDEGPMPKTSGHLIRTRAPLSRMIILIYCSNKYHAPYELV